MRLAKSFVEVDQKAVDPAEVMIKGFMPIGSIDGSGSVTVQAYEIVVPSKELLFRGVRFEVSSTNEYEPERIATVSFENAEKLVKSLDRLASTPITTDRFSQVEVQASVEDLTITIFNADNGRIYAAVNADGTACHLTRQADLYDLAKLVSLAIKHLETKGT